MYMCVYIARSRGVQHGAVSPVFEYENTFALHYDNQPGS